ncbi:DUF3600 domain-containing protein [Niallia sp. 01092]|uniref:DUF3600 domain-containing protein n=1 Tax=unclassified Niallia TaxID=2837522 RepID=UPI003FD4BF54
MEEQNEYNQLITRILSGSEQAYTELYDKTIQFVYKNVQKIGINPKDIEGDDIPANLKADYEKTSDFIEYVNEKQVQ